MKKLFIYVVSTPALMALLTIAAEAGRSGS
jgi:hypothetical protein